MKHKHYKKDPAFLSRPKTGENFEDYKNRVIETFKRNGWLSPEKDEPDPTPEKKQDHISLEDQTPPEA